MDAGVVTYIRAGLRRCDYGGSTNVSRTGRPVRYSQPDGFPGCLSEPDAKTAGNRYRNTPVSSSYVISDNSHTAPIYKPGIERSHVDGSEDSWACA